MQALQFTHKMEFQNLTSGQFFFFFLVLCTSQNVVSSEGPKGWYQGEVEGKLGCASSAI